MVVQKDASCSPFIIFGVEDGLQSGGTAMDTPLSLFRSQQGEQTGGWVGCYYIIDHWQVNTDDVLDGFDHPQQSLPVLGRAQTMPDCDVSRC